MSAVVHLDDLAPVPTGKRSQFCDIRDYRWVDAFTGFQFYLHSTAFRCVSLGIDEVDIVIPTSLGSRTFHTKGKSATFFMFGNADTIASRTIV